MTVCTAAIAEKLYLIGASDRMLTAGDMEFEPEQAKIWFFSPSIYALIAGDMSIQAEIFKRVHNEVQAWIAADPITWVKVKDVASLYCKIYREIRREYAEAAILDPLGLDLKTFLEQQSSMHAEVVSKLMDKLMDFDFSSTLEVIFIGKDHDGPVGDKGQKLSYCQLYTTERDKLSCLTTVGFAAIGIGKTHAESQFMFSGHWPSKLFHETVLLTYAAKKRAEVAPGVGISTDMVVIGPNVGTSFKVQDNHIKELEKIYQRSRSAILRSAARAQEEVKKFIEKVGQEYAEKQKLPNSSETETPQGGNDVAKS